MLATFYHLSINTLVYFAIIKSYKIGIIGIKTSNYYTQFYPKEYGGEATLLFICHF